MNIIKINQTITRIDNTIYNTIAWIEGLMLFVMVAINCLGLVARYIVKVPVFWVSDLSTLLLLFNTMLGAAVAWSRAEHLVLDLTDKLFSPKVKEAIWWLEQVVMVGAGIKLVDLALYNVDLYRGMVLSLIGYDESLKCYAIGLAGVLLTLAAIFKILEKLLAYRLRKLELAGTE